jgi:Zn-dependent protease
MSEAVACGGCGSVVPARAAVCPSCHALVHSARLKSIAAEAEELGRSGAHAEAARVWREALPLLPPESKQHALVAAQIDASLARAGESTRTAMREGPPPGSRWAKILGPFGAAGVVIWKLKFLLVALLTKGKLLLLGLTKMSTMLSALAFLGVYWRAWGWQYAAAVVGMIYIHEIGHVAAMASRGMPAQAPMFVPGLGAFVRLTAPPSTPAEDAKIGLAGPLWGLGATLAALVIATATHSPFWRAVANTAAILNMFNLTPVWQLDGSRGFNALSRAQRWMAVAAFGIALLFVHEGVIALAGIVAVWRALQKDAPLRPDWRALATYVALVAALAAVVPLTARP